MTILISAETTISANTVFGMSIQITNGINLNLVPDGAPLSIELQGESFEIKNLASLTCDNSTESIEIVCSDTTEAPRVEGMGFIKIVNSSGAYTTTIKGNATYQAEIDVGIMWDYSFGNSWIFEDVEFLYSVGTTNDYGNPTRIEFRSSVFVRGFLFDTNSILVGDGSLGPVTVTGDPDSDIIILGENEIAGTAINNINFSGYKSLQIGSPTLQEIYYASFTGKGIPIAWDDGPDISLINGAQVELENCILANTVTGTDGSGGNCYLLNYRDLNNPNDILIFGVIQSDGITPSRGPSTWTTSDRLGVYAFTLQSASFEYDTEFTTVDDLDLDSYFIIGEGTQKGILTPTSGVSITFHNRFYSYLGKFGANTDYSFFGVAASEYETESSEILAPNSSGVWTMNVTDIYCTSAIVTANGGLVTLNKSGTTSVHGSFGTLNKITVNSTTEVYLANGVDRIIASGKMALDGILDGSGSDYCEFGCLIYGSAGEYYGPVVTRITAKDATTHEAWNRPSTATYDGVGEVQFRGCSDSTNPYKILGDNTFTDMNIIVVSSCHYAFEATKRQIVTGEVAMGGSGPSVTLYLESTVLDSMWEFNVTINQTFIYLIVNDSDASSGQTCVAFYSSPAESPDPNINWFWASPGDVVWIRSGTPGLSTDPGNWLGGVVPTTDSRCLYGLLGDADCLWDSGSLTTAAILLLDGYGGDVTVQGSADETLGTISVVNGRFLYGSRKLTITEDIFLDLEYQNDPLVGTGDIYCPNRSRISLKDAGSDVLDTILLQPGSWLYYIDRRMYQPRAPLKSPIRGKWYRYYVNRRRD